MDICRTVTDETLRETVSHGNNGYPFAYYPENLWQFDFYRIDWHWHDELEILFAQDGNVLCLTDADRIELKKGCGIFINSGVLHRFEAKSSTFVPNIVFSPTLLAKEDTLIYRKYIEPVIHSSLAWQVFDPQIVWQDQVIRLLQKIFSFQETERGCELDTLRLLLDIWDLLFHNLNLTVPDHGLRRLSSRQARLQTMMQYIHDHYAEEITLAEIAASASVSKSGALHIFQSVIHTTPVAYLIRYRLSKAASCLQRTQNSISDIASETGFMSTGYFCRQFRRHYGISATEYRKKKAMEQNPNRPTALPWPPSPQSEAPGRPPLSC